MGNDGETMAAIGFSSAALDQQALGQRDLTKAVGATREREFILRQRHEAYGISERNLAGMQLVLSFVMGQQGFALHLADKATCR